MTEKEVVQALRCCAEGECKDCAMHEDKQRCQENLLDKAAEAIGRLTAENAALREKAPLTEDAMINLTAQALGVEPSRLRELAEADKDGQCVVLPCKVGDTVYTKNRVLGADNAIHDEICTRRIKGYGGNALNKVWLIVSGDYCNLSIFPSEFGKTVFFTREEAERAMEEMEAKKDGNETSMRPLRGGDKPHKLCDVFKRTKRVP